MSSRQARRAGSWPLLATVLLTVLPKVGLAAQPEQAPAGLAFRVAKLVSMDDRDTVIDDAVLLVRDGRIQALGPASEVAIPVGYRVLEFPEHWLLPGIVEGHNHSSAGGWGDLNDGVYLTNPGLDTRSIAEPDSAWIREDRTGGITTTLTLPGSATNLSGMGTIISNGGHTPDEMVMRSPGCLKIAQAGNPEWYFADWRDISHAFMNWNLRQTLQKARAYYEEWEAYEHGETQAKPDYDPIWEPLRGTFRHDHPALIHTQMFQVVLATMDMIVGEFGFWTILGHCTFDGWKVGPLVKDAPNTWAINGPRQYYFDTAARRMIGNASGWWKNGVRRLGLNTDAPVVPQRELTYQGAMACWYGWLPYPALRGVTCVPAQAIGVYGQVGSLEVGKQADLSVWTGDPLDPRSACLLTVFKGRIVHDSTQGLRRF